MYDALINLIEDLTSGTNIEIYDFSKYIMGDKYGLKIDLFDHLNKITDFESDIESLLAELDEKLEEEYLFSHNYSSETSINDIDGLEYPDYHCYLKIYKKVKK